MDKPICTVSGMPQRGRLCPNIVVGMRQVKKSVKKKRAAIAEKSRRRNRH